MSYRLTLDHPACVRRLVLLDIVPTYEQFSRATWTSARSGAITGTPSLSPAASPNA